MDLSFLTDYINPVVLGICLLAGYVLKTAFDSFPNKFIPLSALALGCVINILINIPIGINAEVILGGMISGLASTGLYEMLKNLIDKDGKKKETGNDADK